MLPRTKELKLRPQWDGPFTVFACPSPNAYTPRCRVAHAAALPSTSTASNRSLSVSGPRRPRGPYLTRDRRASTRRSCCSTAARCAELHATWYSGGVTYPPTTSGCARRSWLTAARRGWSMMPPPPVVLRVANTHRRCRPPPRRRRCGCRPTAGARSCRLPAAESRRGGNGPRLTGSVLYYRPCYGSVRGTVVRRSGTQGFTHSTAPVGAGHRNGRLAARCSLARAGWPPGPAVPDALVGPLLERIDRNGPSGRHGRTDSD